jgi:hypothetical protein
MGRIVSKKADGFAAVRAAGAALADVEEVTSWGAPALKVRGKMFVCMATNKAAEPNTLVVRMDFAQRDALIDDDPETYYLKDHYVSYACVLVRLSRVNRDALRDLVQTAYRFVSAATPRRRALRRTPARAPRLSASRSRAPRTRKR